MTPTDPIRDEAVKVLAEALHDVDDVMFPESTAEALLLRFPTLARRLALGTAMDTDESGWGSLTKAAQEAAEAMHEAWCAGRKADHTDEVCARLHAALAAKLGSVR